MSGIKGIVILTRFNYIEMTYGREKLKDFLDKIDIQGKESLIQPIVISKDYPEKTREMFAMLMNWLEENVDSQYWPVPNPEYDPSKESREDAPFTDLYRAWKEGMDIIELAN